MQLRRAVPLSLVVLLASAGCVRVGPQDQAPEPVRGPVPPVGAPEVPSPPALPLGKLPAPAGSGPESAAEADQDQEPDGDRHRGPSRERARAKPVAPPRRARVPGHASGRPHRRAAPAPPVDDLCAAADGVVPPSIVDLCLRQYGR
ncbi:hypothetical protein ACF059_06055 [Streptomyces sp. NPDC016562]|uniref:hypothetical protein n=1 Tax=Streptomyces sp. NPDC016562 TaxID=3364966 RepID=UPI0036F5C0D8